MRSNFREVVSEIEEEESSSDDLFEINGGGVANRDETDGSLFSYDIHHQTCGEDIVYVAVLGKNGEDASKDALAWTLKDVVASNSSSTTVYLIHIFPELHYIPTPLGKLPISQVNPEQKNNHIVQERSKRSLYLQKFLDLCSASKVKVETILIESDMEANAILELIPILNIKTLVVGTTKSSLRRLKAGRGSGIAEQILQNAPEFCEVKIICKGKQVSEDQMNESAASPRANSAGSSPSPRHVENQQQVQNQIIKDKESFTCSCFKTRVIS